MSNRKKVVLLGATGSIGQSTLEVIRHAGDELELFGIAGNTRYRELAAIAREFGTRHIAIADEAAGKRAREESLFGPESTLVCGPDGMLELATLPETDIVLVASTGTSALRPTLAAIEAGKPIALANKELLVLAGKFVTDATRRSGAPLIPVDSEHSALFQCLEGKNPHEISRLILTASGGAFLDRPIEDLGQVRPADALRHPNWSMGPKVTVDSATMANKGLEMIEAFWLFDVAPAQIDVVIHRQSIIHSLVEFIDGSILAQLSPPSMTFAIHHALTYPQRTPAVRESLDFTRAHRLDLEPAPAERFPCLTLARRALETGGTAPAVFNTANEAAVQAFLDDRLPFLEIPQVIEKSLGHFDSFEPRDLQDVLDLEVAVRREAAETIAKTTWKTI